MSPPVNSNLSRLPPYLFVALDRKKREALARGVDVINLGIGDPDLPTPPGIVERLAEAARRPEHHRYPANEGSARFREAAARYMERNFGARLDPASEVLALIGSKEGIGHLPLALASPGDTVLVPDPGYPPYLSGPVLAGCKPVRFRLAEENGFLPDLRSLPAGARLIYLNYPNNPTGATASAGFWAEAVSWAREAGAWLACDAAYARVVPEGEPAPSVLAAPGAMEAAIEFHSLSKTFSMAGWRVGWACGSPAAIKALAKVKDNVDSGVFGAVQEAAAWALDNCGDAEAVMRRTYSGRRALFAGGIKDLGWRVHDGRGAFYVWCRPPAGADPAICAERLLDEAGIAAAPGAGFGPGGEGFLRFSLTQSEERLRQALERLSELAW